VKILITGAAGFIGGYLFRHAVKANVEVLGLDIREPEEHPTDASFELCDVRDFTRMKSVVARFRPDRIFHLAAQSYPTVSLVHPLETMDINAGGTINVFECLRELGVAPVVVVACSSAEYGPVAAKNLPIREEQTLRPSHPYGVSKVAQDLLAAQYFTNYSIPAIRLRIFKTSGPGKLADVCSDLARRAVEIERKMRPAVLDVGNLLTKRSIVDVRDLVPALWQSAERCEPGEVYNLGGDAVYSVQDLVDELRAQTGLQFEIDQRPELMRSFDEAIVAGDNAKFRACCEWSPMIDIRTTLRDTLDWWRARLTSSCLQGRAHATA
jgi:GDP-4-dehydro-6-deoxy-D-mannose reductase